MPSGTQNKVQRTSTSFVQRIVSFEDVQSFKRKKATKKYATLDVISGKLCHLDNSEAGEQVTQKDCAVSILESFQDPTG